jgi:hypothetical protein
MTCNEVENWMLTDETPHRPSSDVRRHLQSCARCRRIYGRLVRLIHEVHNAPLPPVPPQAREQVLARLEPRQPSIPLAVAQAEPVSLPLLQRRWQLPRHWYRWAAAAVLCLALGFGTVLLTRKTTEPEKPDNHLDAGHLTLEDRALERHVELAEAREPTRRLHVLSDMAADVRKESMEQARRGEAQDLKLLVWMHARILHEGVLRVARTLPEKARAVVNPVISGLRRAGEDSAKLAKSLPDSVAGSIREMGEQAEHLVAALEEGADAGPAPAPEPPASTDSRSVLNVLVTTSLQSAQEEDPVRRAEQSTQVADTLTQQIIKRGDRIEPEEVARLAGQLEKVMEQAVGANLAGINPEVLDPVRLKQLQAAQERAGAVLDQMGPDMVQQLPQKARENILRAIKVAREIKKPHGRDNHGKEKHGKERHGKEKRERFERSR